MTIEPINYINAKSLFNKDTIIITDNEIDKYLLWLNNKSSELIVKQLVQLNQKLDRYLSENTNPDIS